MGEEPYWESCESAVKLPDGPDPAAGMPAIWHFFSETFWSFIL